jgi:Carbohydrate/starch-binding module (family 21)
MKNLFFILIANVFLLSCTQNEVLEMGNDVQFSQNVSSKLAVGQNVKLIKAKDVRYIACSRGACRTFQTREYVAEVSNLAYNKAVTVRQQLNNGQWEEVNLNYGFTTITGSEIWTGISMKDLSLFIYPAPNLFGEKLSLKYIVNGQTYLDNNNGNDYTVVNNNRQDNSSFMYMCQDFNILSTKPQNNPPMVSDAIQSHLSIAADVRNFAFVKEVKILYTTDNWVTSQTRSLTFNSYESNNANSDFERWTVSFSVPKTNKVSYVLSYKVNGVTYWDNNFGKNYTLLST